MFSRVSKSRWSFVVWIVILSLGLAAPVLAGALLGPSFHITDTNSIYEINHAVAYNPDREEYLVVWQNEKLDDDIQAQRLDKDGRTLGAAFYVSQGAGHSRQHPDVAYNSQHHQYLVVWDSKNQVTGHFSIQARRVSETGMVMDAYDIFLSGDDANVFPRKPAVAYSSGSDRYMVVWAEIDYTIPAEFIYGQKLTYEGYYDGSAFPVTQSSSAVHHPDIAYNRSTDRHLVVWEQFSIADNVTDIVGRQVYGDGGTYSTVIPIDDYPNNATYPAVAALPNASGQVKFLVVHEYEFSPTDHDIHGYFIEDNGAIPIVVFPANSSSMESRPTVTASESSKKFLVAWREDISTTNNPIKVRMFDTAGTYLDQIFEISAKSGGLPAAAPGASTNILITWVDVPAGETYNDIFGALMNEQMHVYIPLINY